MKPSSTLPFRGFKRGQNLSSLLLVLAVSSGLPAKADFTFASFPSDDGSLNLRGDTQITDGVVRLTPMVTNAAGEAWHPVKQAVSAGFESTFSIKLHRPDDNYYYGTDGLTFIVQNSPDETFAIPESSANGLKANALNIKFDSWFNGTSDLSSSSVQVRNGATILTTVDLSKVPGVTLDTPPPEGPPGGGPPQGFPIPTLTVRSSSAASAVRVIYRPGSLDVYFQGVKVINALAVDLSVIGATDSDGKAFLGLSATTATYRNPKGVNSTRVFDDQSQFSDVASWSFTAGLPVEVLPLVLISHSFDQAHSKLTLSWSSNAGKSYKVRTSADLVAWTTLAGAGSIASQGATTTTTVDFTSAAAGFFRVEEN
ncbi:MAG: hypothetical protein JWO82_1697 [Akkermansiaceae bacterium]|nr:hypothetical protein [Akkermansiaceae bacterium]